MDNGWYLPGNLEHNYGRKEAGCIAVDMEYSALLAAAKYRHIPFVQFFYSADSLDHGEWEQRDLTDYGVDSAEKYFYAGSRVRIGTLSGWWYGKMMVWGLGTEKKIIFRIFYLSEMGNKVVPIPVNLWYRGSLWFTDLVSGLCWHMDRVDILRL